MRASAKAAYATVMNPPNVDLKLTVGEAEILTRTTGVGVTNNLFGEGHMPYADMPDGGVLGIYVTVAEQRSEILRFVLSMARGKWRENPHVEVHQAERAVLEVARKNARMKAVIDGELVKLEKRTELLIHPGALNVLVPAAVSKAEAA